MREEKVQKKQTVENDSTFGFWTLLPSAGCFCSLQSVAAALQVEQDPEEHWPWQDWPSMEPTSHSALMVAALSWSRFSSSPEGGNTSIYTWSDQSVWCGHYCSCQTVYLIKGWRIHEIHGNLSWIDELERLMVLTSVIKLILFDRLILPAANESSVTSDPGFLCSWWSSGSRCPPLRLWERDFSVCLADRHQIHASGLVSSVDSGNRNRGKISVKEVTIFVLRCHVKLPPLVLMYLCSVKGTLKSKAVINLIVQEHIHGQEH